MTLACKIRATLPDSTILVSESGLSYVKFLIPSPMLQQVFLLHKELQASPERVQNRPVKFRDPESTDLDITGSPLHYDLSYPEIDETIVDQRNWKKEEELHLPLTISDARSALNCCLEHRTMENCSLCLLAICDGKDNDKTVLSGTYIKTGWFTTIQGRVLDARRLSNIGETPAELFKQYTDMFSLKKHEVRTSVNCTYELCGKIPGVMDSPGSSAGSFSGNLSIRVNWNTLSFQPPITTSTATLVMEIIPGLNGGHLKHLWKELTLLNEYSKMLEQSESNQPNPHVFASPHSITWDEIEAKLILLLNGHNENPSTEDDTDDDSTIDVKLKQHIDNVQHRANMDFADRFWKLLISCADYAQIKNCIHMVLQQTKSGVAEPQLISTNSARIVKIISDVLYESKAVPIIDESFTIELLIDTGLEKLIRDYKYILLSSNLIDIHKFRKMFSNTQGLSFDNNFRAKLTSLAQIHLCLEFTLFAQSHLHCPTANLQSIFSTALQEYTFGNSAIKSFLDLHENQLQCLDVKLSNAAVEHILQGLPSTWCLVLTHESKNSSITTTSYLNRAPILPPNVYCCDESKDRGLYNFLELNISSTRIA